MRVSDKFAALAANAAVSYEEVATALSKVAAQANLAGMSIDYTTALLTKGIETTREPAESIGTALKTIVARMREITDYGKTLEDGMDLNNVETQLAYVDIQLRNQNGELRSTEDVLNDLGKKWDTLSQNQQAAVAKALAGTRQQSRLIAMMQDYDRVIELQEIAQRSQGATAAQVAVYMEGMDAALNKVNVAWEKIVSSIVDSDVIIGFIDTISGAIELVGKFLSTTAGSVTLFATLALLSGKILANKIAEWQIAKLQHRLDLEKKYEENASLITALEKLATEKQITEQQRQQLLILQKQQPLLQKQISGGLLGSIKQGGILGGIKNLVGGFTKGGWVGLAIAALPIAINGIKSLFNWFGSFNYTAGKAAKKINELSNEIYKLNEKASAIKSIEKQYDALDNKIIKTKKDQEEMNDLLDKAADKLSEQEKTTYKALTTDKQRREYLETLEKEATEEANKKRREQVRAAEKLSTSRRKELLDSNTTDSDFLSAQSAFYAINNNSLYEYIDTLGEVADGVESFTQSILENLSAEEAFAYAQDESASAIQRLVDTVNKTTFINGKTDSLVNILQSDDYSIKERISAFKELTNTIASLGDPTLSKAFAETFQQWQDFIDSFEGSSALDYIDNIGLTIDGINNLNASVIKLGRTAEEAETDLRQLFSLMAEGESVSSALQISFSEILNKYRKGTDEWNEAYSKLLNAYQNATGVSLTNVGQSMTSLRSQINAMYEKARNWSSLSETEKTQFMQENDVLFRGESGQALARAFETGNYDMIEEALRNNDALKEKIRLQLQDLEIQLDIAKARKEIGEDNELEISYLEKQIDLLKDYKNEAAEIYRADLSIRLEQEKSQLDLYKEYLQKQKDALQESLEKRKDAYQKYFEAVNQVEEDADYDKQAETLIANLSKLSTSTNGTAMQQSKELEKQFKDLEEERLKTLRERAQEAVLNNLDTEVSEINEKFDKLLEDEAQLLAAMKGEIAADPNNFVQRMLTSGVEGKTALGTEGFIKNNFATAFDSLLPADSLDNIKVTTNNAGNLILNINGTEIPIGDAAQQDLYFTVMNALKQLGLK